MLASAGALPLGEDWAYEVKWDGVRALVSVEGGSVRAVSRNGNDITGAYPELTGLLSLKQPTLLDGELVALVQGVPSFSALQGRMHVRSPAADLIAATPVTFVPFDVLHLGATSLLAQPYSARRKALNALDLGAPEPFFGDGAELLASTRAQGLEGLVAKRIDSSYVPGKRSPSWVKVKHISRASVVVGGWKAGEGGRSGQLGSLLLGVHSPQGLLFAGHVGTGFNTASLRQLADRLAPLTRSDSPYQEQVPRQHARTAHWVEPVIVVDVEFTEWTRDGRLRHPSYKGIRDDLDPTAAVRGQT